MSRNNITKLCGYNIKKIFVASVLLCAAAFMTACGFRNDTGTEYTLNGVVAKVVEAEDKIIIRISPVAVYYGMGEILYDDLGIPEGYAVWDEGAADAGDEPVYGYAEYYGTDGLYDLHDYVKSGNVLEYELERTGDYEEILDFAYGAGSRIVKLTVEDGRILGLEETGYRFVEYGYAVEEYGVKEYRINEYGEIYD